MGARQSKLKKELAALKEQAELSKTKHNAEVEALKSDKRILEFKLNVLQELTAQAQLEAERATQVALESEERMKALKWELVRKLTVSSTSGSGSTTSSRSPATSLATSESSTPRVALNWKLRDGVALRRSSTSTLPPSSGFKLATGQRPHAQSEPAIPSKQVLAKPEPRTKLEPSGLEADLGDAKSDTKPEDTKSTRSNKAPNSNNNEEEKEQVVAETVTTALQPMKVPSSASSSSENESKSKFPAITRKKSTPGPQLAAQRLDIETNLPSPSGRISDYGSGRESESGEKVTRGVVKQGSTAANHSRQNGDESEGNEGQQDSSDSDSRNKHKAAKRSGLEGESGRELSFSDDEDEGSS